MSKAVAKFWPSSWLVPICRALPSRIIAFQRKGVRRSGEALASGLAAEHHWHREHLAHERRVDVLVDPLRVEARASSSVACAVCPSCQRNSLVRRKIRGRSSHRTTLAHWLSRSGRSR